MKAFSTTDIAYPTVEPNQMLLLRLVLPEGNTSLVFTGAAVEYVVP